MSADHSPASSLWTGAAGLAALDGGVRSGESVGLRSQLAADVAAAWDGAALSMVLRKWQMSFQRHFASVWQQSACIRCGVIVAPAFLVVLDSEGTAVSLDHWSCPLCCEWDAVITMAQRAEWIGRADDLAWQVALGSGVLLRNPRRLTTPRDSGTWILDPELDDGDVNHFLEWLAEQPERPEKEPLLVSPDVKAGDNAIRLFASRGFTILPLQFPVSFRRLPVARQRADRRMIAIAASQRWQKAGVVWSPCALAVGAEGELFVSGASTRRLVCLEPSGEVTWMSQPETHGTTAIAGRRDALYIAGRRDRRVWRVEEGQSPIVIAGTGERHSFRRILVVGAAVAIGVLLADAWGAVGALIGLVNILAVSIAGLARYFREGVDATSVRLRAPSAVAVDSAGQVFIADAGTRQIRLVRLDGTIVTLVGKGFGGEKGEGIPARDAFLSRPSGLALGSDGSLFVSDAGAHCVKKVDSKGLIWTVAGARTTRGHGDWTQATTERLYRPRGLAVDTAGTLFIADTGNYRIRAVGADGLIRTVAGSGRAGSSGDDGPARSAALYRPRDVAVSEDGVVYVADTGNRRVRMVQLVRVRGASSDAGRRKTEQ